MHPLVSQIVALLPQVRHDPSCMTLFLWILHSNFLSLGCRCNMKIIILFLNSNMNEEKQSPQSPLKEKKIGQYLLGKTIGEGTFNKVKIARHLLTNQPVAIKMISKACIKTQTDNQRLKKQLKILRKARHPNIIQLYQILQDHQYYYIITEYASRGQLFQHIVKIQKLTQFQASKLLQQLLNAIQYLHQIGVIHRDLKPQNILLDYKYNAKIVDFGLSNIYNRGEMLNTACGSPCYAPPQMLAGKAYDPLKVDIWSLGIVLYTMCFGYLPFDHPDSGELFKIIKQGRLEIPDHASDELRSLFKLILHINPLTRGTIHQIRSHPFCQHNKIPCVDGIIQGLSTLPFQPQIQSQMIQLSLDTSQLHQNITNNKHNHNTASYYLLLQRQLRQKNQSILSYYLSRNYLINRYKLIQRVKLNYDRRIHQRLEMLEESRRLRARSTSKKKRSKTLDKKYHTGVGSNSKQYSRQLFSTPISKKMSKDLETNIRRKKSSKSKSKKKLKRM